MSAALARIRSKVGADSLAESCTRDSCRVNLEDVPACKVIVDMDKTAAARHAKSKRCDFVLFLYQEHGKLIVVPIELKSGHVDGSEVVEQLRNGTKFADCTSPAKPKPHCQPILFHGKRIHPRQRKVLNRSKVAFRGTGLTIKTARCGRPRNLADALGL